MKTFLSVGGCAVLLGIAAVVFYPDLFFSRRISHERSPSASLKTLASAEADFRGNDRDKNGKQDFWRGDVAGLFTLVPAGAADLEPIKLIEISVAGADDRPVTDLVKYTVRSPKAGYWYRALRHADEKLPDPQRFAFCCFPSEYGKSGSWTYILSEANTLYKKDLHRAGGVEVFPLDPLREGWEKLD
jgi:DUF2950 family protein